MQSINCITKKTQSSEVCNIIMYKVSVEYTNLRREYSKKNANIQILNPSIRVSILSICAFYSFIS